MPGGADHVIGQKAILALSEDNESGVIKYRAEQDVVSICEYKHHMRNVLLSDLSLHFV